MEILGTQVRDASVLQYQVRAAAEDFAEARAVVDYEAMSHAQRMGRHAVEQLGFTHPWDRDVQWTKELRAVGVWS